MLVKYHCALPRDDKDANDDDDNESSPQNDFFVESLILSCSSQLSRLGVCEPEHLLFFFCVCVYMCICINTQTHTYMYECVFLY